MPTQHIRDPHLLFFFLGPLVLPFIGVWVPAVHVQEFSSFFSSFSSFSFSIFSSFCPVTPGHPCNHGDPPPCHPGYWCCYCCCCCCCSCSCCCCWSMIQIQSRGPFLNSLFLFFPHTDWRGHHPNPSEKVSLNLIEVFVRMHLYRTSISSGGVLCAGNQQIGLITVHKVGSSWPFLWSAATAMLYYWLSSLCLPK